MELGHITGTVTDGAVGIKDVNVYFEQWDAAIDQWSPGPVALTKADGTYDASGLATGTYRVRFYHPSYAREYYSNVSVPSAATNVAVTAGATTPNINAVLSSAGHITGTVTDGAVGIPNAYVTVEQWDAAAAKWLEGSGAYTAANGTYNITGLATGTYRVRFRVPGGPYAPEYYNNVWVPSAATNVAVTAGATTPNINAVLSSAGHITGTVTDGAVGIPNVYVSVEQWDAAAAKWFEGSGAYTAADGTYNITSLATGAFRVCFSGADAYALEYYNNVSVPSGAANVAVTAGATTPNIHAVLSPAVALPAG